MIAPTVSIDTVGTQIIKFAVYYCPNIIDSTTRHRHAADDVTYTYQIPLSALKMNSEDFAYETLLEIVRNRLGFPLDTNASSIVWRMGDTGQIAFVRSSNSLVAAIIDHKNRGKKVIQLFIVKNDNVTCLPGLHIAL